MNDKIIEEKKNNINSILIAIIIILLLALGGLTYYTFFARYKKVDKPNPVVEPTKPIESTRRHWYSDWDSYIVDTDEIEEVDYSIDTYEGTYSTYTADTSEIDKIVTSLPYSNIINKKISHNQLWKTYKVFNIVENLNKTVTGCSGSDSVSHIYDIKDSNDITYPNYKTESEKVAKDCGLTVEEISKITKSFWRVGGGQYCKILYDVDELKSKYSSIYNEMFNKSFNISYDDIALGQFHKGIFYDHNVNKLVGGNGGGTADCGNEIYIVDRKQSKDNYIVEISEKHLVCKFVTDNEGVTKNEIDSEEDLGNYIITFKLVDGYYQFDNIFKK